MRNRAFFILLLVPLVGCASPDPLATWQARVEREVVEAGGDLNVLRYASAHQPDDPLRPARVTIGELGVPSRDATGNAYERDITGLLLGRRSIQGRMWYIFIVGTVGVHPNTLGTDAHRHRIEGVRAVAVASDGDNFVWALGSPNGEVLTRYRSHLCPGGGNSVADAAPVFFPRWCDQFELDTSGGEAVVVERRSGARWTLVFPPRGRQGRGP